MAAQRTSFDKLQRDRAKKAKQAAKRERKQAGEKRQSAFADDDGIPTEVPEGGEIDAATLLKLIEDIHRDLENETITFEEFEEKKLELMARLPID
jgi:hypothetical protein